jgi:hypothetical protein
MQRQKAVSLRMLSWLLFTARVTTMSSGPESRFGKTEEPFWSCSAPAQPLADSSMLKLFALHESEVMGEAIAAHLGCALSKHEEREFEHKVRPLEDVRGACTYVVHSLALAELQPVDDLSWLTEPDMLRAQVAMGINDQAGAAALGDQPTSHIVEPMQQSIDLPYEAAGQMELRVKEDLPVLRQGPAQVFNVLRRRKR